MVAMPFPLVVVFCQIGPHQLRVRDKRAAVVQLQHET